MKTRFLGVLLIGLCGLCRAQTLPATQPATSPTTAPFAGVLTPTSPSEHVLAALYERGKTLTSLKSDVRMEEADAITQDSFARTGRFYLSRQADGNAKIRVSFLFRESGRRVEERRSEYVFADGWLLDRDYTRKTQVRRQVLKPGEKSNVLQIGQGPFPLPIGQKPEDVLAAFEVKMVAPAGDLPKCARMLLKPRPDTRYARKVSTVEVWVDTQTHFPVRIETMDRNGTTLRRTDLKGAEFNPVLKDADFALEPVSEKDWTLREEPFGE